MYILAPQTHYITHTCKFVHGCKIFGAQIFIEYWIALSGIRENIVRAVAKYWTSRQTSPIFCHSEYNIFTYSPKLGIQYYNYYFDTPQNLQFDIYLSCNFWIGIT